MDLSSFLGEEFSLQERTPLEIIQDLFMTTLIVLIMQKFQPFDSAELRLLRMLLYMLPESITPV